MTGPGSRKPRAPDQEDAPAPHHMAEAVRGGEIILKKRRNRAIFIGGLVAFVLLTLVLSVTGL